MWATQAAAQPRRCWCAPGAPVRRASRRWLRMRARWSGPTPTRSTTWSRMSRQAGTQRAVPCPSGEAPPHGHTMMGGPVACKLAQWLRCTATVGHTQGLVCIARRWSSGTRVPCSARRVGKHSTESTTHALHATTRPAPRPQGGQAVLGRAGLGSNQPRGDGLLVHHA
jgi:hypothetical protein